MSALISTSTQEGARSNPDHFLVDEFLHGGFQVVAHLLQMTLQGCVFGQGFLLLLLQRLVGLQLYHLTGLDAGDRIVALGLGRLVADGNRLHGARRTAESRIQGVGKYLVLALVD